MQELELLEKKIATVVDVCKKLKEENVQLAQEVLSLNKQLASAEQKCQDVEQAFLRDQERLNQDTLVTKMVVDDLIKSIDTLVEGEL